MLSSNFITKTVLKLVVPGFVALVLLSLVACEGKNEPIKVGFVGGLTGRVAGLGIAGRDGALFAIEEINKKGGINGRQVSLLIKDDKQNAVAAKQAVQELIQENVVAIVGHMTSSMTAVTLPVINANKMVMISPTAKSDLFSSKDDYFFRVTTASSFNARKIADLAYNKMGLKTFAVLYDLNNRAFTESWLEQFRQPFEALGGKIVVSSDFKSGSADLSFLTMAKEVVAYKPEACLILASALDTALIAQQFWKLDAHSPLFASEWSFTSDLLNYGGKAVEGLISFHSFNSDNQRPLYLELKIKFVERFGYDPSFASVLSYDATRLLLSAVKVNDAPEQLREKLLDIRIFAGLQSDFKLDQYGDVTRKLFHTVIADGQFKVID